MFKTVFKTSTSYAFRFWSIPITEVKSFLIFLFFLSTITTLLLYKAVYISTSGLGISGWSVYGLLVTTFLLSRVPYAYLHKDDHDTAYPDALYPDVSIIITAKNEEKNIFQTICSCMDSQYPGELECIVVNDGSTDSTQKEIVRAKKAHGDGVRLVSFSENRGKREAMAAGIDQTNRPVVVFVDSDTFLQPDAIHHIVRHFIENEHIGAVSGNTKVENANTNLLTKMQSIQYAVSFDIYKASESVHRSVTCCPGCFSAYRRVAIKPLVQFWKEQKFLGIKGTFGDDRGLTNFVLKEGWDVVYCEKARASTTVPEKISVYFRQQLRWKKSWIREGVLAGLFMWKRRHPLASFAFYINFSFPFAGPVLAGVVLGYSIVLGNPLIFFAFVLGFILIGLMFALFVRVYFTAENWMYMPLFSLFFVTVLIWQMPYALLTLRKSHWGTR
jgi:hyaluronan synthase